MAAAYLLGIREGRKTLRFLISQGFTHREAVKHSIETCNGVRALGFSGEMADFNRGERDFFRHQAKLSK